MNTHTRNANTTVTGTWKFIDPLCHKRVCKIVDQLNAENPCGRQRYHMDTADTISSLGFEFVLDGIDAQLHQLYIYNMTEIVLEKLGLHKIVTEYEIRQPSRHVG